MQSFVLLRFCRGKPVPEENGSLHGKKEMRKQVIKNHKDHIQGVTINRAAGVEDHRLDEFLAYVSTHC